MALIGINIKIQVMKLSIVINLLFCLFLRFSLGAQINPPATEGIKPKIKTSVPDTLHVARTNFNGVADQIEIDRLIVNETITKAGHDFTELFNASWNWPEPLKESFIMIISERPFRGISTQLLITVNDLVVFESLLQTRYDFLEYLAVVAIEQTANYVINYEDIIKQLEGLDTQGSGIY